MRYLEYFGAILLACFTFWTWGPDVLGDVAPVWLIRAVAVFLCFVFTWILVGYVRRSRRDS